MPTENNFTDYALNADENAKGLLQQMKDGSFDFEKERIVNSKLAEEKPQDPVAWDLLKGDDFYKAVEEILKENENYPNGNQKFPEYVTSHPEFHKAMASYLNISENEFSKIHKQSTEIDKLTEGGKKNFIVGKARRGLLGSAYLHKKHIENLQLKKQKEDQAEFDQKVADAYEVVKTMRSMPTTTPGAAITAAVNFLNPYLAPFTEELLADNLRRIKAGKK